MIDAGMCVARLNFSHGDHEVHAKSVRAVREAVAARPGSHVAIMLDTKGEYAVVAARTFRLSKTCGRLSCARDWRACA